MPERFEETDTPSYAIQSAIHKYIFASEFSKNKIILDIACGIGYGSDIILNNNEPKFLVAADNYFDGIRFGKNSYHRSINFCNLSALQLPFADHCFDVVVSFETIEHLKDLQIFLNDVSRILKKDGMFICSTPNRVWSQRVGIQNPFHIKEYTHNELIEILSKHFTKIKSHGQVETASDLLFKFPFLFRVYKIFRPILAKIFRVRSSKVVETKSMNPKFKVKSFWETSPYLIFVAEK